MNGSEIVFLMLIARLILPLGLLMLFGEWMRRRESNYWLK